MRLKTGGATSGLLADSLLADGLLTDGLLADGQVIAASNVFEVVNILRNARTLHALTHA